MHGYPVKVGGRADRIATLGPRGRIGVRHAKLSPPPSVSTSRLSFNAPGSVVIYELARDLQVSTQSRSDQQFDDIVLTDQEFGVETRLVLRLSVDTGGSGNVAESGVLNIAAAVRFFN